MESFFKRAYKKHIKTIWISTILAYCVCLPSKEYLAGLILAVLIFLLVWLIFAAFEVTPEDRAQGKEKSRKLIEKRRQEKRAKVNKNGLINSIKREKDIHYKQGPTLKESKEQSPSFMEMIKQIGESIDRMNEKSEKRKVARIQKKREMYKKKMVCPRCKSKNIVPLGAEKKGFSFGKAVGGTLLAGEDGSLAGFAGKKTGKVEWVCKDCGKMFVI